MCRIWENKQGTDISVEQLRTGLSNELFSEVEGIGFNGGEPTLRKDLYEIVEVALKKLPKLQHVSLITNGFKYKQVIEQIDRVGRLVKANNKYFDVMVSLDGFGDMHDKVRGRSGNFENAKKVLSFLAGFDAVDNVRIGCTVIRENVFHLADLLEYCISQNLYIKYRQGVPHQRLYTENLLDPYALTFEEKYEFVEFLEGLIEHYEPSPLQRLFYRSLIDQILYNKPRLAGCDWQHRGATITAKGELAYCAVKSNALMKNIAEGSPIQAYFGNQTHLQEIINKECANCHHDYVGIPAPSQYRRLMFSQIDEKLRVKATLRKIPGFSQLNRLRHKHYYRKLLNYFIEQPECINQANKTVKQVLICGWYGTETLGDKGIIGGVIHTLRQHLGNDVQFTIVALYPYISEMTRGQMPELHGARIVPPEDGVGLANHMDYVVFGGGPLMAIDSLAPMQAIFERAKSGKACTIVAGCGVGPLGETWHNHSISRILQLSDIRVYRDARSRDYAEQIGTDTTLDAVAEDPAFTWLATVSDQLPKQQKRTEKQILLLGLRDFPYREYARHIPEKAALAIKNNYEQVVIDGLTKLVAQRPDLVIRPLPMCTNHFGSDDRWFYRRLFRNQHQLADALDYSLLGPELPPIDYCKEFRNADALLAMRFHSLVFGLGLGINAVGLDYTLGKGKVRSLAERFGAPLLAMTDLDVDTFTTAIEKALDAPLAQSITKENLLFEPQLLAKLQEFNA
ncbi:hypothetical protein GCM10023116_08820 [Kistimonas scapharcae]|uniref:Radical SAM protein n=2 Tax=Kistimonas scapharcae TaxID=1036133 RepID=A0ABP8UXF5_9GAMM